MARPLDPLLPEQRAATQPEELVWLSASAGTGKTQVLTARVLRLLMRPGVAPDHILCLTFTKAGAAEMASRIQERLAAWVQMPDKDLRKDLFAIGEGTDDAALARARTLFASVIDAPGGGLRIQTIHSFCQTVLASFPVEAGLIPGFRPLEEREQATLRREALAAMLSEAESDGRRAIIGHVQDLALRLGEEKATQFLYRCGQYQERLEKITGPFAPALRQHFELPLGVPDQWLIANVIDDRIDRLGLEAIAAANAAWGTKTGLDYADVIVGWLGASAEQRAAYLGDLHRTLVTGQGTLQAIYAKQLADVGDLAARLAESLGTLLATPQRMALSDAIAGALEAGRDYAHVYGGLKRARGLVDFDDLIARTVDLLFEGKLAEWVRFKLDQRTDHILVDESQDTNANQWAIVNALIAELFATHAEDAERCRTLFTVGDFKQAIFGFQGTSPLAYEGARKFFTARAEESGRVMQPLALSDNFRSTPPILAMVDAVFAHLGAGVMGIDEADVAHRSAKSDLPGRVVLWKPVVLAGDGPQESGEADTAAESEEGWIDAPTRLFAERLARQVRGWLYEGIDGRSVAPGDIMVLVRKRSDLAALIVARLHASGVPVAGVDRLRLNAPLAVQDLLAAIRFALQPHDDLNLASLLVSPLIGWSQEDLLRWGYRPSGSPLWRHLRGLEGTADAPDLGALRDMLARADLSTPYQFLEHILSGPIQGRARLLARLGNEARDPIEELLNAALSFEQGNSPSLQLFLRWFDLGDVDIKREAAARRNEVRVMTVHGSKGLQAPIVILADATVNPDQSPVGGIELSIPVGDGHENLPLFPISGKIAFGPISDAMEAQKKTEREEHWRLLYVAMTRAEEMLFVGGALGPRAKGAPPESSWYAAIDRTMMGEGIAWDEDRIWGVARTYAPPARKGWPRTEAAKTEQVDQLPLLPAWATAPAPQESRPPRPLAPSSLGDDDAADPPPEGGAAMAAKARAAERGRLLHALFERLPDVAAEGRQAAASRWLAAQVPDWAEGDRAALAADALAIIADPAHAALFGPDSLAEAPIAAVLEDGLVVAGTVDRLVIRADGIDLVDFKTGRAVPKDIAAIPLGYRRQLAAYTAALRVIFPGKPVRAALLYTAGPRWFALEEADLDRDKLNFPTV